NAQHFMKSILNHIIIQDLDGSYRKSKEHYIFTWSPNLLLNKMRQACQEKLNRGWIYPEFPMDENMLIRLHLNANKCLEGDDPFIFYKVFKNEEKLEELSAHFYFPLKMMANAWGWNTDV